MAFISAASVAQHETFTVTAFQLRLVILGEVLQGVSHLLVGQGLREPSAALNLLHQINAFVSHGYRQLTAPALDPPNVVRRVQVPT